LLFLLILTPFNTGDGTWYTTVNWLYLAGAFISTIGLILLSRLQSVRTTYVGPIEESHAVL
jgi:hypothetical protein